MFNTIRKYSEISLALHIVFLFLLVDCTAISQWFQTSTLNIRVPIFVTHLIKMASNSAFIRVCMIINLSVKLVTLWGTKESLLFLFWKSPIQRVETTFLKGYFRDVTEQIFTPFLEGNIVKKIVRVVANTIFPLYKIPKRMLFLKKKFWLIESYYFISFAKKKKTKQTNRKNLGRDTATAVANYSEKHSDTRKTTATRNKLLDETRDEHYYILNRETWTNVGLHNHRKQLTRTCNN